MIAQAGTLVYFGYFLYMPVYSRTEVKQDLVTLAQVVVYSLATLGIIAWWWNGEVSTEITALITVFTLAYTAYFLILPAFKVPAVVKPVPERVTK